MLREVQMEPVEASETTERGTVCKTEVEEPMFRFPEAEHCYREAESSNITSQSQPAYKIEVEEPTISYQPAADQLGRNQDGIVDSDSDSDCPMDGDAGATADGLLPEKSKPLYESAFKRFQDWQTKNRIDATDEKSLLAYFSEELGAKKPSTKWSLYSMLRTMIQLKMGINIGDFVNLKSFLKRKADGYSPKKSKIFTKEQVFNFLKEADDSFHLVTKVALIVGVYGACRRDELLKLTLDDIEDQGDCIKITIPNVKTKSMRQFIVTRGTDPDVDMLNLVRMYAEKRVPGTNHTRFFVTYRNGKCTKQPLGINTIAKLPKIIAEYLKLPSPELYTSHCFRRSSTSLLQADSGGVDITVLKRHGGGSNNAPARRTETIPVNPPLPETIWKTQEHWDPTPSTSSTTNPPQFHQLTNYLSLVERSDPSQT
uniref:Putative crypton-1 tc n=1 Tax=Culex tarsalis TaxID=7177 RepID=A0A1Q3EXH3_CULTA